MSKTQECPYPIYPEESTNEKAAFLQRSTAIKRGTERPTRTLLEKGPSWTVHVLGFSGWEPVPRISDFDRIEILLWDTLLDVRI